MAVASVKAHDVAMETTTNTPTVSLSARRFERPEEGRVLAGVAAGLADRIGIAVGVIRWPSSSLRSSEDSASWPTPRRGCSCRPATRTTRAQRWLQDLQDTGQASRRSPHRVASL